MAIYLKVKDIWKSCGDSWTPTLSFNGNGGTGSMESYTGFGKFDIPELGFSRSGYMFSGWNTKPDGSGTSYSVGQKVDLTSDVTMYAQWIPTYTLNYKHTNKTDIYGVGSFGSDQTGHMECYALYINGVEQPDLGKFSDNNNPSYTLAHGTTIKVAVSCYNPSEVTYDDATCTVYLNGAVASSGYRRTEYTFTLTSNTTVEFQWKTSGGLVTFNAKSWEDCYITTY